MVTRDDQGFWNVVFSLLFIALVVLSMRLLLLENGSLPREIPPYDLVLIMLATFRLTRLFVYDKITQFFRDWFLVKTVFLGENDELVIIRQNPVSGPRRTISELLSCPWCIGMWVAPFVTFFYFYTTFAWFIILFLAIAGVATFLQLLSNMIGWKAEQLKQKVKSRD